MVKKESRTSGKLSLTPSPSPEERGAGEDVDRKG